MKIVQNNYNDLGDKYTCPFCKSVFYLNNKDIQYDYGFGLAGVKDGWARYYDCPCCDKRVILEGGDF